MQIARLIDQHAWLVCHGGTSINAWDESERIENQSFGSTGISNIATFRIRAFVETVDLVIDDNQQQLVALAARLIPVEFTQHFSLFSPISSKADFHHRYLDKC
jgi:hypothetical protein